MLSGEATNTNFIVFGLIQSGLEPMIRSTTQGEHANHYDADAVDKNINEIRMKQKRKKQSLTWTRCEVLLSCMHTKSSKNYNSPAAEHLLNLFVLTQGIIKIKTEMSLTHLLILMINLRKFEKIKLMLSYNM